MNQSNQWTKEFIFWKNEDLDRTFVTSVTRNLYPVLRQIEEKKILTLEIIILLIEGGDKVKEICK